MDPQAQNQMSLLARMRTMLGSTGDPNASQQLQNPAGATGANGTPKVTPQGAIPDPAGMTQQQGTQQSGRTDANGVVPGAAAGGENKDQNANPLDSFKDIWNTPTNASDAANNQNPFAVDPKVVMQKAGETDFSRILTKENLSKIAAGGEDAVGAFTQSLQAVAHQVYGQSALASVKIAEATYNKAIKEIESRIPGMLKKLQTSESIRSKNPIFSNPAVKPIISAISDQLASKFPDATQGEIDGMAMNFIEALGSSFAPKKADDADGAKNGKGKETDWSDFLN